MSATPFGFGPPAGTYSGLRRSVIDDVTGQPLVTSAPTGEIVARSTFFPVGVDDRGSLRAPVWPGFVTGAVEAAKFPGQVYRGEAGIYDPTTGHVSEEAIGKAADIAGLAFTGSLPFKAPAGALRSFGGAAAKVDPLADLELALNKGIAENPQAAPAGPRRLDPGAASWDLYHGSTPGPDFRRFDPRAGSNPAEHGAVFFAPNPETASGYASATAQGGEAGNRVFRATVEPGRTKVFDLADMAETDPAFTARAREIAAGQGGAGHGALFDEYMNGFRASRAQDREIAGQLREMGYAPGDPSPVSYGWGHIGAAVERAKAEGLDTAILRGLAEHGGDDQVIALTPGRVRSHYSGDLLYSTAPVAVAGGAVALTAPNNAEAAPSQGTSPVSASPFGFGASMAPEDLARLFGRMPIGAPQGFAPIAENEAEVQRLERATGMVPQTAAASLRAGLADVSPAPRAGAMPVPLPPARPAEFSTSEADLPAAGAQPIMAAPAAPASPPAAPEGPSFGDRMLKGLKDNGDYLGALGAGLLSSPTWAGGISAGIQLASKSEKDRAVTDLAKAEYGLKARKLAQESGALKGNAAILKRAYPSLTDEEAMAQGSNSSAVTEALKILRDPNHGRESDPAVIRARAQAQAEGTAAGGKDDVQLVTRPDGSIVAVNKSQIGETSGAPVMTPVVPGASKLAAEADERRQLVVSQGKDPNDPRYADFIVSGSLPKETQQLLTASDKKAIMEGEDSILSHTNTITQLNRALGLSKKAYDGAGASQRALVTSNLPGFLGGGSEESLATRELDNVVTGQALDSLKSIFGGAPTEGERAILLQIQGSANLPQALREQIYNNAIAKVQQKLAFEQERVNQLRGGTYYKQGNGAVPVPQAAPGASTGRLRFNPATGAFN